MKQFVGLSDKSDDNYKTCRFTGQMLSSNEMNK